MYSTLMTSAAAYQNVALVLLLLCIVTSPTESRFREKESKKTKSAQPNLIPGSNVGMPLMNLCSGDREMKLVCHCSPDDPHVKAQKANCWIFGKDLPRKDANWLAFQTQTTLEQLKITVQKIGNLTYIPSDVIVTLKYLKQLTIEYGMIPDLLNYAFGNLTDLRNITLHKNQIRIVHPFAFANHPEEISLERNEIIELDKEALVRLPQLKRLNLDFNNLTMLHDDVFVDLTSLDELKLESNQLSVLTREIFKGLGNLRFLKLTANSISYIGDTVFAELWSLHELDLDSNHIEKLSARAFDGLNNLRRLNLENNRLTRLERGIFTGVPAVLSLNLNSNQLETITYNNFLPLMDNLVNSTAVLHLKGQLRSGKRRFLTVPPSSDNFGNENTPKSAPLCNFAETHPAKSNAIVKRERTVIIKPIEQQVATVTKQEIQGKLDPVSLRVKEVYYRPNGEATVRCDSRESALKLLSTVKANLSEKYNADVQKALKPRVKVAGFTDDITAENFVEKLIQQNNFPQPANLTVIRIVRNEKHTDNPMSTWVGCAARSLNV
ncbi:connectin-like [Topomyia yanbarensis]|uniref:connectin-like n=1 Tax=Topomyia yanbarensis TaxID=2498891 RepID=UPI00273C3C08|nr:connectin-like [Topomyia yanbarensis]